MPGDRPVCTSPVVSLYIGIDSGTQSTKAVVLDLDEGRVVAEARAPHELIANLPAGHLEQHPQDWTTALDAVLMDVCARVEANRIRGIGISGQQHGFVPLDEHGEVIRPAKLWCDTSTTKECDLLTKKLGGAKAVIRKVGLSFLPGFTAPKILWLKRNEPRNFRRLRHVLLPHDYLNFHLTGAYFMEHGDASGTALMNVRTRKWSSAAISAIDRHLAEWLPPLSSSDAIVGTVRPELARKLGLADDVIVSAGGGDNMMGAIGTGNVKPGVVTASLGTSGTVYAFANKPVVDPRGEIAAFCSSTGGWLPLLCTMNVTSVTEIIRRNMDWSHDDLGRAADSVAPGSGGLVFLPFLEGERTPNLPEGCGVYFGLNNRTFTPAFMARAAMEGVTMGMNYGVQRLAELGVKAREIRLTGGGAKSPVWRRMMADIFGVPVVTMVEDEGAALGGAIQAAWAEARRTNPRAKITTFTDRVVALNESTRCAPARKNVRRYREIQALRDEVCRSVTPLFARQRRLT